MRKIKLNKTVIMDICKRFFFSLLIILSLGIFIVELQDYLLNQAILSTLKENSNEKDAFREQRLSEDTLEQLVKFSEENEVSMPSLLAVLMSEYDFNLEEVDLNAYTLEAFEKETEKRKQNSYAGYVQLKNSYNAIWGDIEYFPVPDSQEKSTASVSYENSWMFERNYGGKRGHEGTDIMAGINQRGMYPIVSMTDGVVEKIGWLEQGGYRIGIRSPHGGYFYYAHMSEYAQEYKEGDTVKAGQLLGFMGDTGYSKTEGTVGKFPVHLHLGIYISTQNHTELSVNPYWILKYLDNSKLTYFY
jgi:murein DD-endopeptidase MepM/ murein hydrolase activator NlpD